MFDKADFFITFTSGRRTPKFNKIHLGLVLNSYSLRIFIMVESIVANQCLAQDFLLPLLTLYLLYC